MLEEYKGQIYKCFRDGYCRVMTYQDQGIDKICPIREFEDHWEMRFARGKMALARGLVDGEIELTPEVAELFYHCTLCGNCREHCLSCYPFQKGWTDDRHLDTVEVFEAVRAEAVRLGVGPLEDHRALIGGIVNYDNPYAQPRARRDRWAKGLNIKDASKEKVDVLYYAGCTASYVPDVQDMARATARLLNEAGVSFGILGKEEKCCGSTPLRLGARQSFEDQAAENIEIFRKSGAKMIVTSCAGCFKTFREDYPKVGEIGIEVLQITQVLDRLIKEGKLEFKKPLNKTVTYHDPCHLGRAQRVFDEPRDILRSLPGVKFVDMYPTREHSLCCGAGGGVKSGLPDLALKIAGGKIEKAREAGADLLVTSCPFCVRNLADAANSSGDGMSVMDITVLAEQALG